MSPTFSSKLLKTAAFTSMLALGLSSTLPAYAVEGTTTSSATSTQAVAAADNPVLETGMPLPSGYLASTEITLKQNEYRQQWVDQIKQLRGDMWDKNPMYNNEPLQDYLAGQGISRDDYINQVTWDGNIEYTAIQRVIEAQIAYGHARPTGESVDTATDDGRGIAENIAAGSPADALIKAWGYNEYDALVDADGAWNGSNGHLHNLLNPSFSNFAMAFLPDSNGSYSRGVWVSSFSNHGNPDGLNVDGTYNSRFTIPQASVDQFSISPEAATLQVGESTVINMVSPETQDIWSSLAGTELVGSWSSSDEAVATVDESGTVTAVGAGTATISFTPTYVDDAAVASGAALAAAAAVEGETVFTSEITVEGAAAVPEPTAEPTAEPTVEPTAEPTTEPTVEPTAEATAEPTTEPTVEPTAEATAEPTTEPTVEPTAEATAEPTTEPTEEQPAKKASVLPFAPAQNSQQDTSASSQLYQNCAEVWDSVGHSITTSDEGYAADLDRDGDGTACEVSPDYANENPENTLHYASSGQDGFTTFYPANGNNSNHQSLAYTGASVAVVTVTGILLVLAGGAVLIMRRRSTER